MMRKTLSKMFVVGLIGLTPLPALASPFTPGDIAVERIGNNTGNLNGNAFAVFVDEYTPAGVIKQTISLPTTVSGLQLALTDSGSATSEGFLSLSGDGHYLAVPGYNAAVGTSGVVASSANRVIGRIDWNGNVDTSTTFGSTAAFAGNNMRSAYTTDGTTFYAAGTAASGSPQNGGVWTIQFGATTGSQVSSSTGSPALTNTRIVKGYGSQLYVSNSTTTTGLNSGLNTVGTGYPTNSGNALANVPGLDNNTGAPPSAGWSSPYAFFLADLNPAVSGFDTAYVADDGAMTGTGGTSLPGGIEKYSLVGGNWVLNNIIGTTADSYRGLTGSVDASGNVQLFATRQGGAATNPGIVSLLDTAGYNANNNGTANLIVPLATNTAFRGIDLVPTAPAAVPEPSSLLLASLGACGLLWAARRRRPVAIC